VHTTDVNRAFSDVDRAAEPDLLVRHLDVVRTVADGLPYRVRKYELLQAQPAMRLLDAGCGSGTDLAVLAAMVGPDGHVTGVDKSDSMLAEARQRPELAGLPVDLELADVYQLPWPDSTFDACHTERLFHHLEAPEAALAELVRVTRSGGSVVAAEPDFDTVFVDSPNRELTRRVLQLSTDWVQNGWIGRHLRTLLLDAGLVEVTCEPFGVLLTDFAAANRILWLERTARRAVEEGLLPEDAVAAWLADLEAAGRNGRFTGGLTAFVASGRKP